MTILRSVWITALLTTAAYAQQASSEWLLQNLPFRLSVEVSNPGPEKATGLARLSAAQARNANTW